MNSGVPMTDRAFKQNSAEAAAGVARRHLLVALVHTRREAAGTPSSHHGIHLSAHAGIGVLARSYLLAVFVHERREGEATDLDVAGVAVHENVVALEIACSLQRLQATIASC